MLVVWWVKLIVAEAALVFSLVTSSTHLDAASSFQSILFRCQDWASNSVWEQVHRFWFSCVCGILGGPTAAFLVLHLCARELVLNLSIELRFRISLIQTVWHSMVNRILRAYLSASKVFSFYQAEKTFGLMIEVLQRMRFLNFAESFL